MASEALKQAMADLASSGEAPDLSSQSLAPSKLGTKQHWDDVYEREVKMFRDIGDEGEVWFGEDSAQDMVEWAEEHFPQTEGRILDVGTGNGQLMFAFSSAGYTSLTGVDYSPLSIQLAQSILESRLSASTTTASAAAQDDDSEDEDHHEQPTLSSPPPNFFTADILEVALDKPVSGVTGETWDLITDKGTYDAVCLSDETREGKRLQDLYVESIAKLLQKGGIFLITSCNWTQAELEKAFVNDKTGLTVHSNVPRASFQFGGSTGSSITTVAFEKQ
ncbi:class I SAM-dependent methyltransferase [Sporobolomyces salmoneus]|uniref:class I SAM-dependent methyltransferase n=1 Tax=Sporobolomyces salmoneus TaxID=183962 RepID=UPI00317ACCED